MTRGQMAKQKLDEIKVLMLQKKVSYDEAEQMSKEPLKSLNEEMSKIAKKFGKKHREVRFVGLMR